MAKQESTVTVQNIKNPGLTRQMTVNSAKMNSRKWKIIDSPLSEEPKKKEVAKPVVDVKPVVESANSFVNDDLAQTSEFAKIGDDTEQEKPKKSKKKSKELNPNDDEAA